MKKFKVTKREIAFFFIGVISVIIIDLLINWQDCKKGFSEGYNSTQTEYINSIK
jgi:hypothetical protein